MQMCGIALPVSVVVEAFRQSVEDGIAAKGYPRPGATASYYLTKGSEDDTSREDALHIDVVGTSAEFPITREHAKIRFIPGEYADGSGLSYSDMVAAFGCPGQRDPLYPPTFFVVRYSFWRPGMGLGDQKCAGEGCDPDEVDENAESSRCDLQRALQDATAAITETFWQPLDPGTPPPPPEDPTGTLYEDIDLALSLAGNLDPWPQRLRTTILETPAAYLLGVTLYAYHFVWRVPVRNNSDVLLLQQGLAANAELAAQYGVVLTCDHGLTCGPDGDDDGDGWCNDVDVCPSRFNYRNGPGDLDGDGVPDVCDNCPPLDSATPAEALAYANPLQLDPDHDALGGICDRDSDNDGVLDEYDIEPLNSMVSLDVDQDGVPEHAPFTDQDVTACTTRCDAVVQQVAEHLGGSTAPNEWLVWQSRCVDLCNAAPDNCSPDTLSEVGTACDGVRLAASGSDRAPQGDDLRAALEECRDLYANEDQATEGAPVGYRCQSRVLELGASLNPHVHSSTGQLPPTCTLDLVDVSYRVNSGPVDGETWNAVSLETCVCEDLTSDGDWSPDCFRDTCPRTARRFWHPITSPDFHGIQVHIPNDGWTWVSDYPFHGDPAAESTVMNVDPEAGLGMARDREYHFSRAWSQNRRQHQWPWERTYTYPDGTFYRQGVQPLDLATTVTTSRPIKLRAGWAQSAPSQSGAFDPDKVTFSSGVLRLGGQWSCWASIGSAILDWRLVMPWEPVVRLEQAGDPAPRLLSVVQTPEGLGVASFDPGRLTLTGLQPVTVPGEAAPPPLARLSLARGPLPPRLASARAPTQDAIFAYAPAAPASDLSTGGDSAEVGSLWIGLPEAEASLWQPASALLGPDAAAVPSLENARLFVDGARRTLYLVGEQPLLTTGQRRVVLASLDLEAGSWTHLGEIPVLSALSGYGLSFDPVRSELLVAGGETEGSYSAAVLAIRLPTGQVRQVVSGAAALARTRPGLYLDPETRRLYVYGGLGPDGPARDLVAVSLGAGTARALYTVSPDAPGLGTAPVFRFEAATETLWVLPASAAAGGQALRASSLQLAEGVWREQTLLTLEPPAEPGTAAGALGPGDDVRYLGQGSPDADYPGEVRLVQVDAEAPGLALGVAGRDGVLLAQDRRPQAHLAATLLVPPGAEYLARIEARPDMGASRLGYVFHDRPASLVPDGLGPVLLGTTSLASAGGPLLVGHAFGVTALSVPDQGAPTVASSLPLGGLVQQVVPLGRSGVFLAVQTFASHDLVVIDAREPGHLTRSGHLALPGRCRSLAVSGGRAYLACGGRGVAVVDVTDLTDPVLLGWVDTPGLALAVAARGDLLVVGLSGRRLQVYRITPGASPALLEALRLDDHPVALQLAQGLVQVAEAGPAGLAACAAGIACGPGRKVEVFRLDPDSGALAPEAVYGGAGAPWQRALWARSVGERVLVPTAVGPVLFRAEVTP